MSYKDSIEYIQKPPDILPSQAELKESPTFTESTIHTLPDAAVSPNFNKMSSSTASQQHQKEQEILANYTVPKPPISTQQSNAASSSDGLTANTSQEKPRTLWMGDLDPWLDEENIARIWWQILGKKIRVKIIRPKNFKLDSPFLALSHSGYCFLEFESYEDAQEALTLNGQLLPDVAIPSQKHFPNLQNNQKKYFRLNWANMATLDSPLVQTPEYSLFVGDLSASTTEAHLLAFFQKKFPDSVKTVRVLTDPVTGKSRCFGFVRFTNDIERQRAVVEMNGAWLGGRPLRVALATPRNSEPSLRLAKNSPSEYFEPGTNPMFTGGSSVPMGSPLPYGFYGDPTIPQASPLSHIQPHPMIGHSMPLQESTGMGLAPTGGFYQPMGLSYTGFPGSENRDFANTLHQSHLNTNNTTVFVGGLSNDVTERALFTLFSPFGTIQQIKLPPGKNSGFVKYNTREEAEEAISSMQGFIVGGNRIRLGWGRISLRNKRFQQRQQHLNQVAQYQAAAALSLGMNQAARPYVLPQGSQQSQTRALPKEIRPGDPFMQDQTPLAWRSSLDASNSERKTNDIAHTPGGKNASKDEGRSLNFLKVSDKSSEFYSQPLVHDDTSLVDSMADLNLKKDEIPTATSNVKLESSNETPAVKDVYSKESSPNHLSSPHDIHNSAAVQEEDKTH